MEASSQLKSERDTLEDQLRECFGRAAYTHKTHEKMADRCAGRQRFVKLLQLWLSAITTSGAIGTVFNAHPALPYVTAFMSLVTLIVSGYAKDIDPGAAAQRHREAASDIWNIREGYLSLLTDVRDDNLPVEEIRRRRDELQAQLHQVYKAAPHTDDKAYKKAQESLQKHEDLTFSVEEIDRFLPSALKHSKR